MIAGRLSYDANIATIEDIRFRFYVGAIVGALGGLALAKLLDAKRSLQD